MGAALGVVAGIPAIHSSDGKARGGRDKEEKRSQDRKPGKQGPCGDGSRKDNVCTKDSQCCTGICVTSKGKNNKDGNGRCRCLKRNKACKGDKNCCNGMMCANGKCAETVPPGQPVETGKACAAGVDSCEAAQAQCAAYATAAPEGTFCLLPTGTGCSGDGDCLSGFCDDGSCAATCTVCDAGCPYDTILAAFNDTANLPAGSSIAIAPGFWVTSEKVLTSANGRNLHIRRCGVGGKVEWESTDEVIDLSEPPHTVTSLELTDLAFQGLGGFADYFIYVKGSDPGTPLALTVTRCSFSGRRGRSIWTKDDVDLVLTDSEFAGNANPSADGGGLSMIGTGSTLQATRCLFKENRAGGSGGYDGGGAWIEGAITANFTDCRFEDNLATSDGGAIEITSGAIVTFTRCSFTGNSTGAGGGALNVEGGDTEVTLTDCVIENNLARGFAGGGGIRAGSAKLVTLAGTTRVTGNRSLSVETPDNAGAISTSLFDNAAILPSQRFAGTTSARVYDNLPDQCAVQSWDDGDNNREWAVVDCATWCLPAGTMVATANIAACCSGNQASGRCT